MFNILRRHPGILFNLLFLALFAFLEPAVLARLLHVIDDGARDPLLGVIFLSAPFLELAGFYLVAPALIDRLAQAPRQPVTLPGLVWMAHLVITLVLLLNGFACFQFDTTKGPPVLGVVVLAVVVIKEIWYLLYWVDRTDPERLKLASRLSPSKHARSAPTPRSSPACCWCLSLFLASPGFGTCWLPVIPSTGRSQATPWWSSAWRSSFSWCCLPHPAAST